MIVSNLNRSFRSQKTLSIFFQHATAFFGNTLLHKAGGRESRGREEPASIELDQMERGEAGGRGGEEAEAEAEMGGRFGGSLEEPEGRGGESEGEAGARGSEGEGEGLRREEGIIDRAGLRRRASW